MNRSVLIAALGAVVLGGCSATSEPSAKGETTGQYIDDATVTAKVKTAIASNVGVRAASNVNVETYQGKVQLSGFADSDQQASQAVDAARKVTGVRKVENDIHVK